jgi:hypothetical protein
MNKLYDSFSEMIFVFPTAIFSGHEAMAVKILNVIIRPTLVFSRCHSVVQEIHGPHKVLDFGKSFDFIHTLWRCKRKYNTKSVLIVCGSPYGLLMEKIIIKLLGFKLIDYVPFPELQEMQDRWHHKFVSFINRLLIDERVLIDYWQIQYSAVKSVHIIRNLV